MSVVSWPRFRTQSQQLAANQLLRGHRWLLVDVETSGFRAYSDRVLSIAATAIDEDGRTEREFVTLLNPGCDPGPVHIHGLTQQRLAGQPVFQDVLPELLELSRDRVLVAHNASFDHDFLEHESARLGMKLAIQQRLCTVTLSRRLGLAVPDHRLPTLAAHWDIRQDNHHDAADDVRVLGGVFLRSVGMAAELGLPLPIVDCTRRPRPEPYSAPVTKTPCPYRYPGRWEPGAPLVQGMKVAITGQTHQARERLIECFLAAGLDVTGAVSSVTSLLVTNEPESGTSKLVQARQHGTPVVDEDAANRLLLGVRAGHRKDIATSRPKARAAATRTPVGRLSGRRVLVLGGVHDEAVQVRTAVAALGAAASVNLSASVTDIVMLPGGEREPRAGKAVSRGLGLLSWPELVSVAWPGTDETLSEIDSGLEIAPATATVASARADLGGVAAAPQVLTRGAVMDLPDDNVLSLNVSWQAFADSTDREVDVVAFLLDANEQVTNDADFVFYNQPVSDDGAVRLSEDGSSEQGVRIDLDQVPSWCHRIEVAAAITGSGTFGDVGAIVVEADAGDDMIGRSRPIATATLDAATTERTMLVASMYRRGEVWRLRAIGQGYDTGLAELAGSFGVDVSES